MSTTLTEVCVVLLAVAIEISSSKWIVASTTGRHQRPRRVTLMQEDPVQRFEALVAQIAQARGRLGVPESARVVVAYEAGQEGFWLWRALTARGIEAWVIDASSLQVDRRARRAKTDRLDAEALTRSLWRWADGEEAALRMVRVPTPDAEDSREWQRERDRLESVRRSINDRIHKKLRTQGIWNAGVKWREALRNDRLRTFEDKPLRPQLLNALKLELTQLEAVEARLKELKAQLSALDPQTLKRIEALQQLRAIGPVSARALSMLLFWRDFDNPRQVGACVGLVGTPHQSGTIQQEQGISKSGNARLRALLIELAWLWLRYQPGSVITDWFAQRTQGGGTRNKRVMIVAVARRLVIALWRYVKKGVVPEGAVLKTELKAA